MAIRNEHLIDAARIPISSLDLGDITLLASDKARSISNEVDVGKMALLKKTCKVSL